MGLFVESDANKTDFKFTHKNACLGNADALIVDSIPGGNYSLANCKYAVPELIPTDGTDIIYYCGECKSNYA